MIKIGNREVVNNPFWQVKKPVPPALREGDWIVIEDAYGKFSTLQGTLLTHVVKYWKDTCFPRFAVYNKFGSAVGMRRLGGLRDYHNKAFRPRPVAFDWEKHWPWIAVVLLVAITGILEAL